MTSEVLYILMRTDLASLNPGKAVAQGAHAAHLFVEAMGCSHPRIAAWEGADRGFGTVVTLGVTEQELDRVIDHAGAAGFAADYVKDPTYPLRDGATTHLIPLTTCGYVFGDTLELFSILGHLELMP